MSAPALRLARLPEGDLYTRHAAYVARLAFRLVGRDADLDDLVQDTFLAAHGGMPALTEEHSVKRWLATVVVRLAGRRLRRRRVATFLGFDDGEHDEHLIAREASPETRAVLRRVYQVLERLPVKQRLAWTLRHLEGEAMEDVAKLCGCSLATAKRLVSAANVALQERVA
jgi:RNA polymerase sigma-70 factor (ECF subfamily)